MQISTQILWFYLHFLKPSSFSEYILQVFTNRYLTTIANFFLKVVIDLILMMTIPHNYCTLAIWTLQIPIVTWMTSPIREQSNFFLSQWQISKLEKRYNDVEYWKVMNRVWEISANSNDCKYKDISSKGNFVTFCIPILI